jgi:hypothetical protein
LLMRADLGAGLVLLWKAQAGAGAGAGARTIAFAGVERGGAACL